jgi:hypothetical protein
MRALRKTHLQKNVAQVFWLHLEESDSFDHWLWKLPRGGNRGKRTTCFPPFPPRLENSANYARVSHSSHSLYGWIFVLGKRRDNAFAKA